MEKRHLARMILTKGDELPDQAAMKWKVDGTWRTLTYGELSDRILKIAFKLKELGVRKGDKVAIFSDNKPEWAISDLSILTLGGTSVPIYATSTSEQA